MFIYNVTLKVDWAIHDAWLQWMKTKHMPDVVSTGCFVNSRLLRLADTDDTEGPTYAAQYDAASKADYQRYLQEYAPAMRADVTRNWGDHVVAFRTLMEIVHSM